MFLSLVGFFFAAIFPTIVYLLFNVPLVSSYRGEVIAVSFAGYWLGCFLSCFLRIPVKVASDSGFMLPLIGAQRRWRLCS